MTTTEILDVHSDISIEELEDKNVFFQRDDKHAYVGKIFDKILA